MLDVLWDDDGSRFDVRVGCTYRTRKTNKSALQTVKLFIFHLMIKSRNDCVNDVDPTVVRLSLYK